MVGSMLWWIFVGLRRFNNGGMVCKGAGEYVCISNKSKMSAYSHLALMYLSFRMSNLIGWLVLL